jgi:WD40 repeat protein
MMHTSEHQAWHVPVGARVFELLPIQGLCDLVIAYAREFMGVSVQTVPNATWGCDLFGWMSKDRVVTVQGTVLLVRSVYSVFSLESEPLLTLVGHTAPITHVSVMGSDIASGARDRTVRVWNGVTGECLEVIQLAPRVELLIHVKTGHLVAGFNRHSMQVYADGEPTRKLSPSLFSFLGLKYGKLGHPPDLELLESCSHHFGPAMHLMRHWRTWNLDGSNVLATLDKSRVYMHDKEGHLEVTVKCRCLCLLDEGRFAIGRQSGKVRVFNYHTGMHVFKLVGHAAAVCAMAQMPDGHLASASRDNQVRVWDLVTGDCVRVMQGIPSPRIKHLVALDTALVALSKDCTLCVWE